MYIFLQKSKLYYKLLSKQTFCASFLSSFLNNFANLSPMAMNIIPKRGIPKSAKNTVNVFPPRVFGEIFPYPDKLFIDKKIII